MGAAAVAEWRAEGTVEVWHYADNRNRKLAFGFLEDAWTYPDYPDFHQPALLFHGAHDDVVPAGFSEEFARAHRNARLEILDSGHDLLNVLEYIAPKLTGFLLAD